jgi:hypothetical protein
MHEAIVIGSALLFPVACLGVVLWLGHMEDTLSRDVHRSRRRPDPAPILAVPVQARAGRQPLAPAPRVPPTPRPMPMPMPQMVRTVQAVQTPEVARSAALSLGGSTNR